MKRKGFTLVELSIVLVIIGLLIGGILAAQSMISTAKINSMAMQIGQFDAQIENFRTKYNALPGDAKSFGGDGDGLVTRQTQLQPNVFDCEMANFWIDIDPSVYTGATNCNGAGTRPTSTGIGKDVPLSKLGKDGSYVVVSAVCHSSCNSNGYLLDSTIQQNFYIIFDSSNDQMVDGNNFYTFNGTGATNSAVKPSDLLALDSKIDDGIANFGNVKSGSAEGNGMLDDAPTTGLRSSGTSYIVNDNAYECTPMIRIGAQVGDPQ